MPLEPNGLNDTVERIGGKILFQITDEEGRQSMGNGNSNYIATDILADQVLGVTTTLVEANKFVDEFVDPLGLA